MSGRQLAVDICLALSLLVVAGSTLGAVVLPSVLGKLHYLTTLTSVAGPLLGLALVLDLGWGISAGLVILTVALLAVSGAILTAATGRLTAQRDELIGKASPP